MIHTVLTLAMCLFMFGVGPLRVIGIPVARADAAKSGIPFLLYRWFGDVKIVAAPLTVLSSPR
ncbi:hypothetical protein ACH4GE_35875 [Streptomyces tendae]|uniref:hypothetical protein n=1 Tax=Streptomyces tendae TaxID=1932 RepID=UPI0037BE004F